MFSRKGTKRRKIKSSCVPYINIPPPNPSTRNRFILVTPNGEKTVLLKYQTFFVVTLLLFHHFEQRWIEDFIFQLGEYKPQLCRLALLLRDIILQNFTQGSLSSAFNSRRWIVYGQYWVFQRWHKIILDHEIIIVIKRMNLIAKLLIKC